MKYVFDRRLPKATLLRVRWVSRLKGGKWFLKMRGANFLEVFAGRLNVLVRMPWLRHSAEALHPELFREKP